jgi:polyisoprenoid-binding protein YceI
MALASVVLAVGGVAGSSGAWLAEAAPLRTTAAQAGDGLTHLTLVPNGSEARYRIHVKRLGQLTEEICRTRAVTGDIVLDSSGAVVGDQSRIVLDQRTLQCDQPSRTSSVQNTLQTAQYPTADFVVRQAPGLPQPLPTSGDSTFAFVGDLTVHGVTRPASWQTAGSFTDQQFTGQASTPLKMSEYGMTPPRVPFVLSVEDDLTIEVSLLTTVGQGAPAAAAPAPAPGPDPAAAPAADPTPTPDPAGAGDTPTGGDTPQ